MHIKNSAYETESIYDMSICRTITCLIYCKPVTVNKDVIFTAVVFTVMVFTAIVFTAIVCTTVVFLLDE